MEHNIVTPALMRAGEALASLLGREMDEMSISDQAFILYTLPDMQELVVPRQHLARSLQRQLSPLWIETGELRLVFATLAALWKHDATLVSGANLASAVQRLVQSERSVGGPYGDDLNVEANAQIALFLRHAAKPLPKLDAFLQQSIISQQYNADRLSNAKLHYLLAKACPSPELVHHVAELRHQPGWQSPPSQAAALLILGDRLPASTTRRMIRAMCERQQPSGLWDDASSPRAASPPTNRLLTVTALIMEALAPYRQLPNRAVTTELARQQNVIAQTAKQVFHAHAEPLRSAALDMIDHICRADRNYEIALLPYFFARALNVPVAGPQDQHVTLGVANLCVWTAYTIYDDLLDGEGTPARLPVANVAMRASLDCFARTTPIHSRLGRYIAHVFTAMDETNALEVATCRFAIHGRKVIIRQLPKYRNGSILADRSFAHALGPMIIMMQGLPDTSRHHDIEQAFRHYLIARQLNDDLHDWQKDMRVGQASYVVTAILRSMRVEPGEYDLPTLLAAMQKNFRCTTLTKLCNCVLRHINMSRRAFARTQLLRASNSIYELLDTMERSVWSSLDAYQKAREFSKSAVFPQRSYK